MRYLKTTIASMSQNTSKDGNYYAYLYRFGKDILYVENTGTGTGTKEYILDANERDAAKKNPEAIIRERVSKWASKDDNPLSFYAWGLQCLEDDRVSEDFIGDCVIVKRGNFNGGLSPISFVVAGKTAYPFTFKSAADAQAWIDKKEYKIHYLSHDEVSSPDYFIINAHGGKTAKYRSLKKDEIIISTDEYLDEDGWRLTTCVGSLAPDPQYTCHRQYRRRVDT